MLCAVLGQSLPRRHKLKSVGSSRQLAAVQCHATVLHEERDEDLVTTSSVDDDVSRSGGRVYFDVGDDISYVTVQGITYDQQNPPISSADNNNNNKLLRL